jgi:F-type H+-transporting ATPase subunit b
MRTKKMIALLVLVLAASVSFGGVAGAVSEGVSSHAAEECIELLEAGGTIDSCQEAPNPILPEPVELIWGTIAFVVLFAAMAKFALPAVKDAMDAREERIRTSIDEAESTRAEAATVLSGYQAQLADAKAEAARIIEEARQTADSLKRDLTARAEAEAAELRQRNADQVAAERDRVMAELQGQVATLAIELAEKVVESNLDREVNMRLIESYINSVGTTGGARA